MRINPVLVAVAVLLNSSPLYAADCSISFDQSCLSQGYSQVTAEKSQQQPNERLDHLNKEACKEAIAERRRMQLIQNQLDTELALNELVNRKSRGDFNAPRALEMEDAYLPTGTKISLAKTAEEAAFRGAETNIRQSALWNQKMIEAKSAEDMASCLVEE